MTPRPMRKLNNGLSEAPCSAAPKVGLCTASALLLFLPQVLADPAPEAWIHRVCSPCNGVTQHVKAKATCRPLLPLYDDAPNARNFWNVSSPDLSPATGHASPLRSLAGLRLPINNPNIPQFAESGPGPFGSPYYHCELSCSGGAPPTDENGFPSAHGSVGSPRAVRIPFVLRLSKGERDPYRAALRLR